MGGVVIPKGIRRTLRLREGTPLGIFTDREGGIILKEYSPMAELTAFSDRYAEVMVQSTGMIAYTTDRDRVTAVSGGSKKDTTQKTVSRQLGHTIGECNMVMTPKDDKAFIPLTSNEMEGITAWVTVSIICKGDAIGPMTLLSRDAKAKLGSMEIGLVLTAAAFLGRQMEA